MIAIPAKQPTHLNKITGKLQAGSRAFTGAALVVLLIVSIYTIDILLALVTIVLVLAYLLPPFFRKPNPTDNKKHLEALFQSSVDAYIILDKETREIVDHNTKASLMFEVPESVKLKGLYFGQLLMRKLA